MDDFNGLTISQLKVCYGLFQQQGNSFYLSNCRLLPDPNENFNHFEIETETDKRVLFYPVTLYPNSQPSAEDLAGVLQHFVASQVKNGCSRLVIPIGEISKPLLLTPIHHMVTLIIDFLPGEEGNIVYDQPQVYVRIVDSFRFSFPGCHQTEGIIETVEQFFRVVHYRREYLGHQNWLDRRSCCYFTLKVISKALVEPIDLNRSFVKTVPHPDTWIFTSENWLTRNDRKAVCNNLMSHFKQIERSSSDIAELMNEIIEL